jgi:LysM repeat protein
MPRAPDRRRRVAHVAAPVLFLAAVTVAVLLIRSGLESGSGGATSTQPVTRPTTATTTAHRTKPRASTKRFYTVQTGDTFNAIAAKTGVSVTELERLNPGVSSNALQVGQKLRVK